MVKRITWAYEGLGMKLVVDLPDELVGRIRDVVKNGGYDDSREFVETAIENQLELEEGSESQDFKTLDQAIREYDRAESKPEYTDTQAIPTSELRPNQPAESGREYDIELQSYREVVPVQPPSQDRVDDGPLWGQYNRLLPVKFVLRRLANSLAERADTGNDASTVIDHGSFSSAVAQEARLFGKQLEEADDKISRGRGEKLAAGFPTGEKTEKSLDRFESHFVGYSDRNGNLTGAPAALLFVDITASKPSEIGITQAGLDFAEITNPVLDETIEADEPLSPGERKFYLKYVSDRLPSEVEAMVFTAQAIQSGDNRPTSLTERVAELDSDWSQAQASTYRSGLVSRLYELNLVDRFQVGQRGIGYELTKRGNEFLQNHT
jgi:Arc/MetJ-type ribon-helix-helix transcriptional regulator